LTIASYQNLQKRKKKGFSEISKILEVKPLLVIFSNLAIFPTGENDIGSG
jgi:hypothetical protein